MADAAPSALGGHAQASAKLEYAAGRLRKLLAIYLPLLLIGSTFLSVALLCAGLAVGFTDDRSGFIVGGILSIACMAIYVSTSDVWGAVNASLCMLELSATSSKEEILQTLQVYQQTTTSRQGKVQPDVDDGELVLTHAYKSLADVLFSKLTMALQWGPFVFFLAAVGTCIMTQIIEEVPDSLRLMAILVAVIAGAAMLVSTGTLLCFIRPIIAESMRTRVAAESTPAGKGMTQASSTTVLDLHVRTLRRKLISSPQRQSAARTGLLEATQSQIKGELRRAVEEGWFAGIEDEELEQVMVGVLLAACATNDIWAMDFAIQECKDAGMPESRLEDAQAAKMRIEVVMTKLQTGVKQKDVVMLTQAIHEAQALGIAEEKLVEEAVSVKATVEQFLQKLWAAMESRDVVALQSALESDEARGLPQRDLQAAEELKSKIQDVLGRLESGVATKDIQALNTALEEVKDVGIPDSEAIRKAIEVRDELAAIYDRLQEAIKSKNLTQIQDAIAECREAGLPESKLQEAIDTEDFVLSIVQRLETGVAAKDLQALDSALAEVKDLGIPDTTGAIAKATELRDELAAIHDRLQEAVKSKNLTRIQDAIAECREAGIPESNFQEAIETEEWVLSIVQRLEAGVAAKDVQALNLALSEVEDWTIPDTDAVSKATALRDELASIYDRLQEAIKTKNLTQIQDAIAECREAGLPESNLQEAIETEESIQKLIDRLKAAVESKSTTKLQDVLEQCRQEELPEEYQQEAKAVLANVEHLLARLQQGVENKDLMWIMGLLADCYDAGIPEEDLQEAVAVQAETEKLLEDLKEATEAKELPKLKSAVDACRSAGLPERDWQEGVATKNRIEGLLRAKLSVAVQLQDFEVLTAAIAECKSAGLPEQDLTEAVLLQENMEKMFADLKTAISEDDMAGFRRAIEECSVDMLKAAVEQSRSAGVPQQELEEAMAARAKNAEDLPERERERLLDLLSTCSDEEKRAQYNEAVNMLRDAIQTGEDVPPAFEELVNELIVQQVM